MKRFFVCLALVGIVASQAQAQFVPERVWVGPTIGLGAFGGSLAYGLGGEYAMDENFGLLANIGYTSFTEDFGGFGFDGSLPEINYSLLAVLVGASYHFKPNAKFDPYLALGVGYFNWDISYTQDGETTDPFEGFSASYNSGIGFSGQIGARYHFSPNFAGRLTLGYPMIVGLGADYAFGGVSTSVDETPSSTNEMDPMSVEEGEPYHLLAGLYGYGKATIKTEVNDGNKTGVVFNTPPDFGISIMAPFGKGTNIGFVLDIGSANYGVLSKPESQANDSNTVIERYNFLNVFPHLNVSGFIVGVNFGFPQSAFAETLNGKRVSFAGQGRKDTVNDKVVYSFTPDAVLGPVDPVTYVADMIELRIGGSIPVVDTKIGRLAVNVMAGYTLTQLFEDPMNYGNAFYQVPDPTQQDPGRTRTEYDENLNPIIPSLSLGLQWDFKIGL